MFSLLNFAIIICGIQTFSYINTLFHHVYFQKQIKNIKMNIRSQSVLIFIITFFLFVNFSYTAQDVNIVKRIIPQLFKVKKAAENKLILEVKWDGTGIKDHGMIYNQKTILHPI